MPTVRMQDKNGRPGRSVHGVPLAKGTKQDGGLHLFYTLCNVRLEGEGGDEESNYVEDNQPTHITCKRCQAQLAREAQARLGYLARERARRAVTRAARMLVAHFETLDVDAECESQPDPEEGVALREAAEAQVARLRRLAEGRRLQARRRGACTPGSSRSLGLTWVVRAQAGPPGQAATRGSRRPAPTPRR